MTPEEKQQRIKEIEAHRAKMIFPSGRPTGVWAYVDDLLSLDKSQEAAAPPVEELTAASVLDQSLNTLKQIRDLTASSRSYVPQSNAAEMVLRLEALGFGSQEPRRGNTLWSMVMDAADEIERLRKIDANASMRSRCVEVVEKFRQRIQYQGDEGVREAMFGDMVIEMESISLEEQNHD